MGETEMKKLLLALCFATLSSMAYADNREQECNSLKDFAYSVSEARQNGENINELKRAMIKPKNLNETPFYEMTMSIIDLVYKYPIAKDRDTKEFTHTIASAQVYLICYGTN